jgi:DNA-binding CsgD family transcriptional regulator
MKTDSTNKQKAFRYYVMGLTSKEIAKLLDLSHRTVEGYMSSEDWQNSERNENLKDRIMKMQESGKSYAEIAKSVGRSKSTVYNFLRRQRA